MPIFSPLCHLLLIINQPRGFLVDNTSHIICLCGLWRAQSGVQSGVIKPQPPSCVSGPVFVDDVADDERGEEEQAVAAHSALCLHVDLMDGDHLPLWCGCLPHNLQAEEV